MKHNEVLLTDIGVGLRSLRLSVSSESLVRSLSRVRWLLLDYISMHDYVL